MKDIKKVRLISYLRLKAKYYELLYNREVEFDCLNQNFKNAKEFSYLYFVDEGHDKENLEIYDCEMLSLKYCLDNLKEYKKLNSEVMEVKEKLIKAESKLK